MKTNSLISVKTDQNRLLRGWAIKETGPGLINPQVDEFLKTLFTLA